MHLDPFLYLFDVYIWYLRTVNNEDDDNRSQLNFGRRCHRRGNHEEIFGKLKFIMPKFSAEPSTRNFSGGSKSITKFAAENVINVLLKTKAFMQNVSQTSSLFVDGP